MTKPIILPFFFFVLCAHALATENCISYKANPKNCLAPLELIHPSQAAVGLFSIRDKAGKLEKEWAQNELEEYLKEEANPAVISPNGRFYIIDGHHFHYAMNVANIPEKRKVSYLRILADFRGLPQEDFQKYMIENSYVYLKDKDFKDIEFDHLPDHISKLADNPYRSLAWIAKERGCFEKTETPFAEFLWGDFFKRRKILIDNSLDAEKMERAVKHAMNFCASPDASKLPGYLGR